MRCEVERMDMAYYDITLHDLAKKWKKSKEDKGIATSTMLKYENILRAVEDHPQPLYAKKARDIKKHEISTFFNYLAFEKHLSLSYIKNDFRNTISQIFNFGIENDMILKNPCKKAELPNIKEKKSEKDTLTPEEIDIIESNYKNIAFGDIVYMLINTGLRSQEVSALNDKSFITVVGVHYIRVGSAMKKNKTGGWELGITKTDDSERGIPISDEIYASASAARQEKEFSYIL